MKRKLKKPVVIMMYISSFLLIIGSIFLIDISPISNKLDDDSSYVNDIILKDDIYPVVGVKEIVLRPFLDDTVTVKRGFYNSAITEEEQQASLIYYDGTYIPNSGVDYQGISAFDVMAILDGSVTKVTENSLLGKIIEITHNNNLISVYQSLSDVKVAEGEQVIQGQIIGKSGESNISLDLGNHLHFEIIHNGQNIDPQMCYGKQIDEI